MRSPRRTSHPTGRVPTLPPLISPRKATPLPASVAEPLRRHLTAALALPALKDAFAIHGAVPAATTGDALREFVARDIETNRRAIRLAGIQPE